ncbi:unnamed protein product (macronuclear) [Paramecium tetraurelia]|uniref:RRM domain-containing protein n=1 Tax=Paramecium tetraurelia TaxID=5888 RepID=A0CRS9_PARTE|nr:uncharacterized protein GSPATT00009811001 [Paramecium tetraurelia]CAK73496.1 unnamed protein product [Paramecium tetraurelia]|eukprot:XP_001440893.1 hypothetical protein (macronuclear) [Paramecium tetraurelia strain d4-2]
MQYQDSRRVINPIYQDQPKQVRPRSISNTTKLLAWDTQQFNSKTDITINCQTTSNEVKHAKKNQRNTSSILGGDNFAKVINQRPYYDFNEIIKSQHVVQSTKEKIINPNKLTLQDDNQVLSSKESKSQERQSTKQINFSKGEKENYSIHQQELMRLNKTENVKSRPKAQNDESKQHISELKRRMMNYPQRSQSPSQHNTNPKSCIQMEDNNITIISMNLKDIKDDVQAQEIKQLCQNIGYHMVKFDKEYDKINHKQNGFGSIQIRGINTDQKLATFQRSLSRKGINIGEQNQKLKDFVSNRYLLKSKEHSQANNQQSQNQEEKLLNNFKKFQSRQKGLFV